MTDDSTVEREAIESTWSGAQLLLCTFHFLQRRWNWLHDSKNKIAHKDRIDLMHIIKSMVYAKSELELNTIYAGLNIHKVGNKYQKFINHVRSLWPKRIEWATCFRNTLLIRGNNTNNYAEAGIKIIKEQVFVRIKAYNVIEMFGFITNYMEHYYQQKLLAVSNNRLDYFVSEKFLGKGATRVQQNTIECLGNATFKVQSTRRLKGDEQKFYEVDMHLGTCSCAKGIGDSPCVHQSAVVLKYKIQSVNCFPSLSPLVNCFPSLSPLAKQEVATLALGSKADADIDFYVSLHQENYEQTTATICDQSESLSSVVQQVTTKFEDANDEEKLKTSDQFVDISLTTLKKDCKQ